MSYIWTDERKRYPDLEDTWECDSCGASRPSRRYRDWFGTGDTDEDLIQYLKSNEDSPLRIFFDAYMVCIIYAEYVIVFGYDGNEYCHSFCFDEPTDKISQQLFSLNVRKL